ncbi:MAG: NUDIX domain-containing protein [Tissierellia bacterium]|nr:NUDIX domain-containing protein [Tissierellia bacterium]
MEYWDIYRNGKKIGMKNSREELEPGEYHIIVEGWIQVGQEEFIIQRRSYEKKIFPGWWTCSVSGSLLSKETPIEGLIRETKEELGIDLFEENIRLYEKIRDGNALFYIYHICQEFLLEDLKLDPKEVMDVNIVKVSEIYRMIKENSFVKLDYYDAFFRDVLED